MTLAGIITMILSIGCAWALLLACSARLLRGEAGKRKEEDSSTPSPDEKE